MIDPAAGARGPGVRFYRAEGGPHPPPQAQTEVGGTLRFHFSGEPSNGGNRNHAVSVTPNPVEM